MATDPAVLTSAPAPRRLIGLDLLRLLAVVLVLGRHMEARPTDWQSPLRSLFDWWFTYGGMGVDVFFVLSGFLVSGLLFSEYRRRGQMSVKRFYVRRAWKIYPSFYFLIGFTYLYCLFVLGEKPRDRPIFSEIFFIQSYQHGFWNHTWTLGVEEHFYIALPLLLLVLARRNRGAEDPFREIPYLVVATSIAVLGMRIATCLLRPEYTFITHAFPTHLRIDELFFGVGIAYAYHFHSDWFRNAFVPWRYALICGGAATMLGTQLAPPLDGFTGYTFTITQTYLGCAALLIGVLMCRIPHNWLTVALAALGSYSYSIYLWHMALMYWAMPQLRELSAPWSVRTMIYMVGAFAIGIPMAKLLELPTLRFRDRKYPSRVLEGPVTTEPAVAEPTLRKAA